MIKVEIESIGLPQPVEIVSVDYIPEKGYTLSSIEVTSIG